MTAVYRILIMLLGLWSGSAVFAQSRASKARFFRAGCGMSRSSLLLEPGGSYFYGYLSSSYSCMGWGHWTRRTDTIFFSSRQAAAFDPVEKIVARRVPGDTVWVQVFAAGGENVSGRFGVGQKSAGKHSFWMADYDKQKEARKLLLQPGDTTLLITLGCLFGRSFPLATSTGNWFSVYLRLPAFCLRQPLPAYTTVIDDWLIDQGDTLTSPRRDLSLMYYRLVEEEE